MNREIFAFGDCIKSYKAIDSRKEQQNRKYAWWYILIYNLFQENTKKSKEM